MNKNYILQKPHVTEKSAFLNEKNGVYCLDVHPNANKLEIKEAVESFFDVKVLSVKVVRKRPVTRTRQGRVIGRTTGSKKAYIHLAPGEKLDLFEGA